MSVYLIPLQSALLLFPFLAAMITLPYIIIQYRKYGSILPIRVLIVYSFIFYLLYQGIRAFVKPHNAHETCCLPPGPVPVNGHAPFYFISKIYVLRNGKGRYEGKVLMDDYNPFFFTVSNGAEPAFPVIVVKVPLIGPLRIYAADDIHQG